MFPSLNLLPQAPSRSKFEAPVFLTPSALSPTVCNLSVPVVPRYQPQGNFYAKELSDPDSILMARSLLYHEYIERLKWHFHPKNPSQLRVEIRDAKKILADRFDAESIWFGIFCGGDLIACTRLCGMDKQGKFEVEGYPNSFPIHHFLKQAKRYPCFEVSRAVVREDYASKGIFKYLLFKLFEHCEMEGASIFTCTSHSHFIKFLPSLGWPLIQKNVFKYEDHDPEPVHFYFADYRKGEISTVIHSLKKLMSADKPILCSPISRL